MWLLAGAIIPSFLTAWACGYVVRRQAAGWGLLDHPGHRKVHSAPTPLGGGLAIWAGVVLPLAAGQAVLWCVQAGWLPAERLPEIAVQHLEGLAEQSGKLWFLLAAGTVLMLLGLADDLRGLDWRPRLLVQALVAVFVVQQGWSITLFVQLQLLTAAITVLWIVGLVNSFNMLDNMDGLSGGVAVLAAGILAGVMLLAPNPSNGQPQLFVAGFLLVLAAAILGFLWHNRPPARIFMGDAGSYFIGFMLAAGTIMATFSGGDLPRHAVLAPLLVLAVPLYDTFSVIFIRLRAGRSPFEGDRNHFSHRLVQLGMTKGQAVLTIYLTTAACGMGALLLHQVNAAGAAIILLLTCCVLALVAVLELAGRKPRP